MNGRQNVLPPGYAISTLEQHQGQLNCTLDLIEKCFAYQAPHKYCVDFAPLMDKSNHVHSSIILKGNHVVAHLACLPRTLVCRGSEFPVILIGGVAVDEKERGNGLMASLMNNAINTWSNSAALFLLWSDLEKVYEKWGFAPAGRTYEVLGTNEKIPLNDWEKSSLDLLPAEDLGRIKALYEISYLARYTTLKRDDRDWELLKRIKSTDLFVKRDQHHSINSYFFRSKGMDLKGVIHEFASLPEIFETTLSELTRFRLWTAEPMSSRVMPTALAKAGRADLFHKLAEHYAPNMHDQGKNLHEAIGKIFRADGVTQAFSVSGLDSV